MNKLLFLLLISLFSFSVYSQNKKIVITGKIINISRSPLYSVNIIDAKSNQGAVSDQQGSFKLVISELPVTLQFSHIGYKSLVKRINKSFLNSSDSVIYLNIILKEDVNFLKEVEISTSKKRIKKSTVSVH